MNGVNKKNYGGETMKKLVVIFMCTALFIGMNLGAWHAESFAAPTIKWKAQAGMPSKSWSFRYQFQTFADRVKAQSGGRLEIKIFPPGAIVGAYEIFDAVKRNAIQVGMGVGGYNLKHIPEGGIEQGLPGTFATTSDAVNFLNYYKNGAVYEMLKAAYMEQGTYLLRSFGTSPLVLISKKPINSVQEIKGLKIRGSGEVPALIKNLGAAPVTMAPAEVYMALQTGTIDGVIFPAYTIGTLKLWDVAKGLLGPSFGQTAGDIYVNLKTWNKLPDDLKWVVEEAALYANHFYQATIDQRIKKILKEAETAHGVKIVNLPPNEYDKIIQAAQPIMDKMAKKSDRSAKLITLMKEYMAE